MFEAIIEGRNAPKEEKSIDGYSGLKKESRIVFR